MDFLSGLRGNSSVTSPTVAGSMSSPQLDPSASLCLMLLSSILFLVGLLLNGFTLRFYLCRAQHGTSSSVTVYLHNLVVADVLLCLSIPLRVAHYASTSSAIQWLYCNFGATAFYLNMYASILFMGFIAANRYLRIVHPLGTHLLQKVQAAYVISTLTWLFLLVTMGTYIGLSLLTEPTVTSDRHNASCDRQQSTQLHLLYMVIHSCCAAIFFSVLVCLVFFYYSTTCKVVQLQRKHLGVRASRCKKLARARRNMLVLVSGFCVCFVPYHLVRLPYVFAVGHRGGGHTLLYLKEMTVMLSILNICLDPIIYFILCKASPGHRAPPEQGRHLRSSTQAFVRQCSC